FDAREVRGRLSVDVNGHMARTFLLPELPALLARHPGLSVHIGEGDRLVDLVREGVDCVIRAGMLPDSDMIVRRLGIAREITVASPAYLERFGIPASLEDLEGHRMVGYAASTTGQPYSLEFDRDGREREILLPHDLIVRGAEIYTAAGVAGLGLIQVPRYRVRDQVDNGALVSVLEDFPPPPMEISILYPQSRYLSSRVRVFIEWITETFRVAEAREQKTPA
ncbi:MAG: LysR family transcriptional regulator, partial [Mesorhizobium sp.]